MSRPSHDGWKSGRKPRVGELRQQGEGVWLFANRMKGRNDGSGPKKRKADSLAYEALGQTRTRLSRQAFSAGEPFLAQTRL